MHQGLLEPLCMLTVGPHEVITDEPLGKEHLLSSCDTQG